MSKAKQFYSPCEAAEYLGLSQQMLSYYRLTGRIAGEVKGNTTIYTKQQLDEGRERMPTKQKGGRKTQDAPSALVSWG